MISNPPFEAVLHTASPVPAAPNYEERVDTNSFQFHFNVKDTKKDLLDPAINGTVGILKAIKASAPHVKHVVITSSFASILNADKGQTWPEHTYTEADWNPITLDEATKTPAHGYRASKTFAEKAAWEFLEKEKPNFTLSTANPPMVFGPIVHYLNSLDALNTSNARIRDMLRGEYKNGLPDTGTYIWIDVRDLALAHVKQIELPEAAGKRFFITAGYFSNELIAEIIRKNFPEYKDKLPEPNPNGQGGFPDGTEKSLYKYDNRRTREVLGIEFRSLEESITDLVKSLKAVGI